MKKPARHKRIRSRYPERDGHFLGSRDLRLSREQAVLDIVQLLDESMDDQTALQLIELFNIQGEELAEAGVPFETLKALERKSIVLKNLR